MAAKCRSSPAIRRRVGLGGEVVGEVEGAGGQGVHGIGSDLGGGPAIVRHHRGLAASPRVRYTFEVEEQKQAAEFIDTDLQGSRFIGADLSGAVMRGVVIAGAEIDSPWLAHGESLLVNGVDVIPLVEAELDRRFPGRVQRRAEDPDGLREAWSLVEATWAATLERAAAMPAGSVDVSVAGEWSFAQTLRHLVMATDLWLRQAILEIDQPFHPLGQAGPYAEDEGMDMSVFTTPLRRTTRCWRPGRAGSRWCATSSPPSPRTSWTWSTKTPGTPRARRPPGSACT